MGNIECYNERQDKRRSLSVEGVHDNYEGQPTPIHSSSNGVNTKGSSTAPTVPPSPAPSPPANCEAHRMAIVRSQQEWLRTATDHANSQADLVKSSEQRAARRREEWLKRRQQQRDMLRDAAVARHAAKQAKRAQRAQKKKNGEMVSDTDTDNDNDTIHNGIHTKSSNGNGNGIIQIDDDTIPPDEEIDYDDALFSPNFEAEARSASQVLAKEWAEIWEKQQQFAATRLEQYDVNGDGTYVTDLSSEMMSNI
jgi:hypothetical protein